MSNFFSDAFVFCILQPKYG